MVIDQMAQHAKGPLAWRGPTKEVFRTVGERMADGAAYNQLSWESKMEIPVKIGVIIVWLISAALMIGHNGLFAPDRAGSRSGDALALVCYSLPFLILLLTRIPEKPSPQRTITLTLFVLILAFTLYLPCVWLMPGHRRSAFDGMVYFFLFPFLECGAIALFLVVRSLIFSGR